MLTDSRLSSKDLPLISIAIPVFNEATNLAALYSRLDALGRRLCSRCHLEFVFSDNHSNDSTWSLLQTLAARDARVRAIRFSKNVGFQRSILVNYLHTRGDAVMQIDADLQDPPELLERFLDEWERGAHVVYGIRRKRPECWALHVFRRVGYWVIDAVSEHPIPRDVGDFRLVDRKVIHAVAEMKTPSPYLRGMIAGLGFQQVGIEYERSARIAGESKFGIGRLIGLGLTAVLNHSVVPLRLASIVGAFMLGISALGALYYLTLRLLHPELPRGLASIHILVLFGIGLQSLLLGLIGEYLLRIYIILRCEPIAVIEASANFAPDELKL